MKKRLCKSGTDRKLCGVCGGLGVYLNIDSTVVRLIWCLVTLCSMWYGYRCLHHSSIGYA